MIHEILAFELPVYKPRVLLNATYNSISLRSGSHIENNVIFSCGCTSVDITTGFVDFHGKFHPVDNEYFENQFRNLNILDYDAIKIDLGLFNYFNYGVIKNYIKDFSKPIVFCCEESNIIGIPEETLASSKTLIIRKVNKNQNCSNFHPVSKNVLSYDTSSEGTHIVFEVDGNLVTQYKLKGKVDDVGVLASCITAFAAGKEKLNFKEVIETSLYKLVGIYNAHADGLNLFYNIKIPLFSPGRFMDFIFDHPKIRPQWHSYINHKFLKQLGNNTLDINAFKYFLKQDYIYLTHYARAASLAGYKADNIFTIVEAADLVKATKNEMRTHIKYCDSFGISLEELNSTGEAIGTLAYSRFLTDIGNRSGWLDLTVATSPCLFGYGKSIENILNSPHVKENNRYWKWIETYSSPEFAIAANAGRRLIEKYVLKVSNEKIDELVNIFLEATKLECNFWNQALNYQNCQ